MVFVIPFVLIFIVLSAMRVSEIHPIYLLFFYVICTIPLHLFRKDLLFLSQLEVDQKLVYLTEYNLIVVPFSLSILFTGFYWTIPIGHILSTSVAFIPNNRPQKFISKKRRTLHWIPSHLFEWRTMFRNYYWGTLLSYFIGLLLSFSVYTLPALTFYWITFIAYAFNHVEPKEMIEVYNKRKGFILQKIKDHSLFFHILFVPHYCMFLVFHFQSWILLTVVILFAQLILLFCILFKYSYKLHDRILVGNPIPVTIFTFITIILLPVSLMILFNYWKKANAAIQT